MKHHGSPISRRQACVYLAAAASTSTSARASTYPDRPVKIIVPYAAGGASDITARIYAEALGERLKQPFTVENRPGASGITASATVAKAPADGYTLILGGGGAMTIHQSLYPTLPYDPVRDFTPIGLLSRAPLVMLVSTSLPANSVAEFVAYAKRPAGVTFASPGAGTVLHLAGEMFMRQANLKSVHVPYKGSAPALADLAGGRVDIMLDGLNSSMPLIRAGKIRALAVTTARRSPDLPDIPTLQEAGFTDFDVSSWFGLFAPAKTPSDVVQVLATEIQRIGALPAMEQKFAAIGLEVTPSTPEKLQLLVQKEAARWREVVRIADIKVE